MIIYQQPSFTLSFGTASNALVPADFYDCTHQEVSTQSPFKQILAFLNADTIVLSHQTHGTKGIIVRDTPPDPFTHEADFSITNIPGIALAVCTADCLPIAIYAPDVHAIAMIHAGWRSTVNGILTKAIEYLCHTFGADKEQLQIFFGPAAGGEHYEVTHEFLNHLAKYDFAQRTVAHKASKLYFDLPYFNELLMQDMGVHPEQCSKRFNYCTLTDTDFTSHRRNPASKRRQISCITLKNI